MGHPQSARDSGEQFLLTTEVAVATDFQSGDEDVKISVLLQLVFQGFEGFALKFLDPSAAQAGHVNMVSSGLALVEVLFTLYMHEIEFVDELGE